MKKSNFKKAGLFKVRNLLMLPLFFILLFSGLSLSAQQSHTLQGQDPSTQTDAEIAIEPLLVLLENKQFVPPTEAVNRLEGKFVEIDELFSNGNLTSSQEVFHAVSQQFNKHLYVDLQSGSTVKTAFEDNLNNLLVVFNNFQGASFGLNPQQVLNDSINLLSR